MIGHKHVIDMRMDGVKPDALFLEIDSEPPCWWRASSYPHECEDLPNIFVPKGEPFARLDLRFMVGLMVHLRAPTLPRMVEGLYACKKANAARVLALVVDEEKGRVTYMQDTETGYVWQGD